MTVFQGSQMYHTSKIYWSLKSSKVQLPLPKKERRVVRTLQEDRIDLQPHTNYLLYASSPSGHVSLGSRAGVGRQHLAARTSESYCRLSPSARSFGHSYSLSYQGVGGVEHIICTSRSFTACKCVELDCLQQAGKEGRAELPVERE